MAGWKDWVEDKLGDLEIDLTIGSGEKKVQVTTSGATGRPSVSGNFGGGRGGFRYGDVVFDPTVLMVGAVIIIILLLRR